MSNRKNQKLSSKKLVLAVIAIIVIISTLAWHEIRVTKREAAAAAQSVYED